MLHKALSLLVDRWALSTTTMDGACNVMMTVTCKQTASQVDKVFLQHYFLQDAFKTGVVYLLLLQKTSCTTKKM